MRTAPRTELHAVLAGQEKVKAAMLIEEMEVFAYTFLLIIRAAGYHDAGLVRSVKWSVIASLLPTLTSSALFARGRVPADMLSAPMVCRLSQSLWPVQYCKTATGCLGHLPGWLDT